MSEERSINTRSMGVEQRSMNVQPSSTPVQQRSMNIIEQPLNIERNSVERIEQNTNKDKVRKLLSRNKSAGPTEVAKALGISKGLAHKYIQEVRRGE